MRADSVKWNLEQQIKIGTRQTDTCSNSHTFLSLAVNIKHNETKHKYGRLN
jgi:hypothetical protein